MSGYDRAPTNECRTQQRVHGVGSGVPEHLQDRCWLLCTACGHVEYVAAADLNHPRSDGKPKAGGWCPECSKHGQQHLGRLVTVRAHLTVED